MTREIRRIQPFSAVRVGFFFGLAFGFVFGLFNGMIVSFIAQTYGPSFLPPGSESVGELGGGALIVLAIFAALMFSLLWAFTGLIFALLYNLIAGWFGGIEFSVIDHPDATPVPTTDSTDDEDDPHE
ncbi:DUF3566 domain-containing protein [candidate division KSB1 bacterium]|nr:DUF3566 domain-containing protein [candidate division KSB1 bacterium]